VDLEYTRAFSKAVLRVGKAPRSSSPGPKSRPTSRDQLFPINERNWVYTASTAGKLFQNPGFLCRTIGESGGAVGSIVIASHTQTPRLAAQEPAFRGLPVPPATHGRLFPIQPPPLGD